MNIIRKYFILFVLLQACRGNDKQRIQDDGLPLYASPITVALDTTKGYTFNPITGDSIKPLLNAAGDTVKTGVPIPLTSQIISATEIVKPTIIEGVQIIKTNLPDNVHIIPDLLPVTFVDSTHLKKVKPGEGDRSFILRNTYGVVTTGIPIPVTGKKMPFSEPHPVKAAPMRYKDNASTSIQYLDVEQGLSYSYITAVFEDKKGNLWFGVDGIGISKYDGINITTYSVKEGLTHNIVNAITEDRNNNLWIATSGGVTCFDGNNFTQYTEKDGLPSNNVLSIMEDKKGDIWICTTGGLTRYDGKHFTTYTVKEGLPSDIVYKCIEDRNGSLWIATHHAVARFDGINFTLFTPEDGLAGYIITTMLEDVNGNLWFGSLGEGLCMFDGTKFTRFTTKEGLSDNIIWSIIEDNSHNIWISTSAGGLNKYNGKNFTQYGIDQGLSNIKVRGMSKDKTGNIWLATEGGGINKINKTNFNYGVPENVVENNRIRPILKDKEGNLWFGTENANVGKLNMENSGGNGKIFTYYRVLNKFLFKGQRSLLQDTKDNIWIGTTGSGIIKYDGKIFTNYSLDIDPEKQSIYDMLEDKKGNIWFGQNDGSIASYNGKDFFLYTTPQGLPGSIIYSIMEDKKGNIWFCTKDAGVYKYDGINLINYTEKQGLFSKSVLSVTEDEKGNIWFGTMGSGSCLFDGKHFTYYTEKQGLANNNVWSVFCDPGKQLWFGTDKGLTLFVPKNNDLQHVNTGYSVYNFGSRDGIKAIDFNLHSVCIDKDKHIWWGTGKSAPSFDLNKGFHADSLHSLCLNYIEINDQFYDFRNLDDSADKKITCSKVIPFTNCPEKLSLSYDLNHLSFHFSAIDWSAPDKIKYSYRMIGLDEEWSNPSEETIADYRNLSHGEYEFQVRAIGQSHVWTESFKYSFIIRPSWWQTGWFKALAIVAALVLAFFMIRFIYYYQLRKERTVLEKQLAVQLERQRIAAEMHDDIGAGLSGIRLMTEMAIMRSKNVESVSEIEKIYNSVGDISSKMKVVIWSLNTENDSLGNLLTYLQKQARQMMENYPGSFSMNMPELVPDIKISGETRRHIYLAVKEALHNIIKHSGADKINLTISYEDKLIIGVSDNGNGMNTGESSNSGNGLKNMKNRMKEIGGKFSVINKDGLTLIFEIPLNNYL